MISGTRYRVPEAVLRESFAELRRCGAGRRECQVLWTSPWIDPARVTTVIHPVHHAQGDGFELDGEWLTTFWRELVEGGTGVRVQVHTHPGRAFHSATDDEWPIVHTPGFLSLVIPRFGLGEVGFEGAYLAELGTDGRWCETSITDRLEVV